MTSDKDRREQETAEKRLTFRTKEERKMYDKGLLSSASGNILFASVTEDIVDKIAPEIYARAVIRKNKGQFQMGRDTLAMGVARFITEQVGEKNLHMLVAAGWLTSLSCLQGGEELYASRLARIMGTQMMKEFWLLKLQKEHPEEYAMHLSQDTMLNRSCSWEYFHRHFERRYGIPVRAFEMDNKVINALGTVVLAHLLPAQDLLVSEYRTVKKAGRIIRPLMVYSTPKLFTYSMDILEALCVRQSTGHGFLSQMPDRWNTPSMGGYSEEGLYLVKGRRLEDAMPEYIDAPGMYDVLNLVQNTPWQIDTDVADLFCNAVVKGTRVGGLSDPLAVDVPPMIKGEAWEVMDKVEQRLYSLTRRVALREWVRSSGSRLNEISLKHKVRTAQHHAKDAMYFPTSVDFRGRMYNGNEFGPQGRDSSRAMLRLKNGAVIDSPESLAWLRRAGASLYGFRGSFDDAEKFILENHEVILSIAADPLGNGNAFWEGAKDPWQFMRFCKEYRAGINGDPVHMPVSLDGTCHGIQIWSLLLKDKGMGQYVNLLPSSTSDEPNDIYQVAADSLIEVLKEENKSSTQLMLDVGIDRNTIKPIMMSIPYGLSVVTIQQLLYDYLMSKHQLPDRQFYVAAREVSMHLYRICRDMVTPTIAGMKWLRSVCSSADMNEKGCLEWRHPLGMTISQTYKKADRQRARLQSLGVSFRLSHVYLTSEVNTKVIKRALPANFIHGIDSALMMESVLRANREYGITDFSMIHDCYGVHPNDATNMSTALRDAAVDLFDRDLLTEFAESVDPSYTREDNPPPISGDLNLVDLKESTYFFS